MVLAIMSLVLLSCENIPQDSVLNELKSKIGNPTQIDKTDPNNQFYMWNSTDIGKSDEILNSVDKALNMLPTKKEYLAYVRPGVFRTSREYDLPKYLIKISIRYYDDRDSSDVRLWIKNK